MDSSLFLTGAPLDALVVDIGQYAAAGVGTALVMWCLGYVMYVAITLLRGCI